MILLDTHIWAWWVQKDARLTPRLEALLRTHRADGLGVSVFSCWEIANLVRVGRMQFLIPTQSWIQTALGYPGIRLLGLTPEIVVEANELPEPFHKDPADRILVATARTLGIPMLTVDTKILVYPHVQTL